jgi:hypothetical protein
VNEIRNKARENKKKALIKAFRKTCNITEACRLLRIDRHSHYDWLEDDPEYAAAFEKAIPDAATELEANLFRWRRGVFEPYFYRGKACYATRKRVMCVLEDETQCFEDELPEGAVVIGRKNVVTADGKQLGTWRPATGILQILAAAWMPKRYGTQTAVNITGKINIVDPDESKRELYRAVAGVLNPGAAPEGDGKPE